MHSNNDSLDNGYWSDNPLYKLNMTYVKHVCKKIHWGKSFNEIGQSEQQQLKQSMFTLDDW